MKLDNKRIHIPSISAATKDDLISASKAIHDQLKGHVDGRLDDLEDEMGVRLGKVLEKESDRRVKFLGEEFTKRLEVNQKRIEETLTKRLEAMEKSFAERSSFLQQAHEKAMESFKEFVKALPQPNIQVSMPEHPITVNVPQMKSADVIVNVPQQKSIVNLPEMVVHLPQQLPSEVIVNLPEQKSADVIVNIPPPRKMVKRINYDKHGRPDTIAMEEVD